MLLKFLRFLWPVMLLFTIPLYGNMGAYRKLEEKVKYSNPLKLLDFANAQDTLQLKGKYFSHLARGKFYFLKFRYDSAYTELSKAKYLASQIPDLLFMAEASIDLASCYSMLDNSGKALEELLFAKDVFLHFGTDIQKGRVHIALGELYRKTGDYAIARDFLEAGKSFYSSDKRLTVSYLNRVSAILTEKAELDSSFFYSFMALKQASEIGDAYLMGVSENEIGYLYKESNDLDSAIYHLMKADSLFRSIGNLPYALHSNFHLGMSFSIKGDNRSAVNIYLHAYRIANENNWFRLIRDLSEGLRNSYGWLNKSDSMLFFQSEMYRAEVFLNAGNHQMNMRLIESLYAQEKFDQKIREKEAVLEKTKDENVRAYRDNRILNIFLILVALILALAIVLIYLQIQSNRKIKEDQQEMDRQNKELQILVRNNEALVQEISHRVKNNLSVLSGLLGIQRSRSNDPGVKKELTDAIKRVESISAIHNQLYDSKDASFIHVKKVIEDLAFRIAHAMGYDPDEVMTMDIEDIELDVSNAINVSLILNELITNCFKHAFNENEGTIKVKLKQLDQKVILEVADRGKGFSMDEFHQERESMGLYLIRLLARQMKGQVSLDRDKDFFYFKLLFTIQDEQTDSDSRR